MFRTMEVGAQCATLSYLPLQNGTSFRDQVICMDAYSALQSLIYNKNYRPITPPIT